MTLFYVVSFFWIAPACALVLDSSVILRQESGVCALTFDDGPTPYTAALLDALRAEGVLATFFVLGKQVQYRPQLLRRMVDEGHEVATHGFSHPNMRRASLQTQRDDLERALAQLRELGIVPRSFRPPYGRYDEALAHLADSLGLSLIMWTMDSRDWKRRPADYRSMPTTSGRALTPEEMRGIFLFHDTRSGTVEDLSKIVRDLRAIGCTRFVTVREYMDTLLPPETLYAANGVSNGTGKHANGKRDKTRMTVPAQEPQGPVQVQDMTQPVAQYVPIPAGTTPVPMARSSSPWIQPTLLRSRAQGT